MSDQQPVYGPPPANTSPPMPAPPYPGAAPVPPAEPKRKTALVIAIVAGVLVLCCCIGGTAMAFLLYAGDEDSTTSTSESTQKPTSEQSTDTRSADDEVRLQEWLDWQRSASPTLESAPSSFNDNIAEAMGIVAPDFDLEETAWLPAEYDEAEDWYYADAVYVRATLAASSKVSAAVELWIQSDDMITNGVDFDTDEGDILTTIADGNRQLLYVPQWGPAGFQPSTKADLELWKQIGSDWPDAVVTGGTEKGDQFVVTITKWGAYAVDDDYPVVSVTYEYDNGDWTIVNWEYKSSHVEDTSVT